MEIVTFGAAADPAVAAAAASVSAAAAASAIAVREGPEALRSKVQAKEEKVKVCGVDEVVVEEGNKC